MSISNKTSQKLNDLSTYDELFNFHIETNKQKILILKSQMNDLIEKSKFKIIHNELPLWLDYVLYMLSISFVELNNHTKLIINLLNAVNEINVHPGFFSQVFINIIYSVYIVKIISNLSNIDYSIINQLANASVEVELCMNIYDSLFINVDADFLDVENSIGYNQLLIDHNIRQKMLNDSVKFTNIDENKSIKLLKLNLMIISIEDNTNDSINAYIERLLININNQDMSIFMNKLNDDLQQFHSLMIFSHGSAHFNAAKIKSINKFIDIDVNTANIIKFVDKNAVLFWSNYVADSNAKIINYIFK